MSSTLPPHVGVYGGGRMGAGITHALLLSGSQVTLVERDGSSAEQARARVAQSLRRAADHGNADAEAALKAQERWSRRSLTSRWPC